MVNIGPWGAHIVSQKGSFGINLSHSWVDHIDIQSRPPAQWVWKISMCACARAHAHALCKVLLSQSEKLKTQKFG